MEYLIQGYLLGIAYVAPIGTQNLFVINTALTRRRTRVLLTAAIVAFFDITLYLACFYGIGALMAQSLLLELAVVLIGSVVVMGIGISLLRDKGSMNNDTKTDLSLGKIIFTACVVTWFNPQAIIDGTMLLGASRATIPDGYDTFFVIGAGLASLSWWLFMPLFFSLFKTKMTDKALRLINIVCGAFILFYGAKLLYSGIRLAAASF